MMEKYDTEDILRESQENVKKLNEKLKDIESLHNEIKESVSLSLKNPILFKELAEKLNNSAELYLNGNNKIFDEKIVEISSKITELDSEITRLLEVDFNLLFKDLETKFLDNSKEEIGKELKKIDTKVNFFQTKINDLEDVIFKLAAIDLEAHFNTSFKDLETKFLENSKVEIGKELKKFEEKTNNFQNKIDDLGKEITRLSKIDLEEHFNKHQNKLSEVFISVNGINGILATISQNINKVIQNFGDIEQTLSKNQKEINKGFDTLTQSQEKTTNDLLNKIKESDTKLDAIVSQNELLKKELDFNKKLNFAILGLLITIIVLVIILN